MIRAGASMNEHSDNSPVDRVSDAAETNVVDAEPAMDGALDPLMLELLVCPLSKKPLDYDAEANELISAHAGLAYPVRGGVPILLPSEARSLADDEPGSGGGH